jgi:RHS repeat-associated protein
MQVTRYNRLNGKVARRSVPTSEGTPDKVLLYDEFEYDAIGREIKHTTPWGAVTRTAYKGLTVDVTEPLLYVTSAQNDALERPVVINDAKNGLTKYGYGPFGGLSTIEDPGGAVLRTTRDALQRVRMIEDPNRGTTIQEFDGYGELRTSTDALNRVTTFEYDELGRTKWRKDKDGANLSTTTWTWDTALHGIGKLHKLASPDGVKTFAYNAKGQLASQSLAVTGEPELLAASVTYDEFGRLDSLSYPAPNGAAPFAVKHVYDPHGFLRTVRDAVTDEPYWHLTEVDSAGRIGKEKFGNDVITERAYYEDKQALKSIKTTLGGAPTIQDLSYDYDLRLNLKRRTDALQKLFKTERFRHDQLDRLTCSYFSETELPLAPCAESFEVAPNGNLTFKSDVGVLKYDDPKHPHAVTGAGGDAYLYDAVGNQIGRPGGTTVAYTAFDLPKSITQGANVYSFGYDGDHRRIRKTTPTTETLYFGDLYERVMDLASSATEHRYYVHSPERVIAVVTRGGPEPGTKYLHTDNLGSVDVITNADGGVEEHRSYKPFGERRSPIWGQPPQGPFSSKTTKGFTGHEEDSELGLVNAKGRIYDPRIGRFLSVDPIVSNRWRGQSLNAYSYVRNNPLAYIDPSGFQGCPVSACIPDALIPTTPPGGGIVVSGGQPILIVEDITVHGRSPSSEAADVGAAAPPVDVGTTGGSPVGVPRAVIPPAGEGWKPSSPGSDGDGAIDPSWPTADAPPPVNLSDYIGKVLRLEIPPDEIGVYSLAYSIKHDLVDPIRRRIADEPQPYLAADGAVRKFSGHRDYSDEMAPVLGKHRGYNRVRHDASRCC